jgi:DNA polymerase I-like protein with 3'-5' exonuclease and polymerase domains
MDSTELILDVETTTYAKGNPFSRRNSLCYVGTLSKQEKLYDVEYSEKPYSTELLNIQQDVDNCETIVGFNIKFDLHWIKNYGIIFVNKRVWDCQIVHFILSNQKATMPSLNDVAAHYGLKPKLDVVATEYWDKGIDTKDIPRDVLEEYLSGDLELTKQVYEKQKEEVAKLPINRQRLISLHNQDLLVLEEMEFNGLLFDEKKSTELGKETQQYIDELDKKLNTIAPIDEFNWNSNDHLSTLLYGGDLTIPRKEVIGEYKTGVKKGSVKYGWVDYTYKFDRLFNPIPGSELKKEGFYSTDEQTLKSLKGNKEAKKIIDSLLERSLLEKRRGTYYDGIPKLIFEMDWEQGKIHGQLNQSVARTGRLSSSKPNLQNFDSKIKELFYSRY